MLNQNDKHMLVYSTKIMRCVKSVITNYFMLDVRRESIARGDV